MGERPAARIRNAQLLWRWLDSYQPGLQDRVRQHLPPEIVQEIENAVRTAWLPMERDIQFVRAVVKALGRDEAKQMWRQYAVRFKDEPLVKPLYEASVRIFGFDLIGFCRAVCRFYNNEYRAMGVMEAIGQDDKSVVVMLTEMPPEMFEDNLYLLLLTGMFEGMYDVAKLEVPALSHTYDREKGYIQLILDRPVPRRVASAR